MYCEYTLDEMVCYPTLVYFFSFLSLRFYDCFGNIYFTMACIIGFLRVYNFPLVIIHNGANWSHNKSLLFFPRLKKTCINTESHILAPPTLSLLPP